MSESAAMKWINSIIDEDSFIPLLSDPIPFGGEVITGFAKMNQRPVAIYAHNTDVDRGYVSPKGTVKIVRLMDRAKELAIPIIALLSSPGISLEDNLASGEHYTRIITRNITLSGIVPQLAVIMGPTLGAPAYSSVLMDFTFFNKNRSYLMVTSPMVVQQAIGEKVTMTELGGTATHAHTTGLADFIDDSIAAQLLHVQKMIDFLPSSTHEKPRVSEAFEPVQPLPTIPSDPRIRFNMLELIQAIVDNSELMEFKQSFGQAMICAFVRIQGYPVGIVANQSTRMSGAIDCDAAQKSARFIRLCDAYRIPILTLIDVPGFMPGKREEHKGLLQHGARLCAAMQTRVPRLSVVVRKCYGAAAFLMMQTKAQDGDLVLALESAQLGVMGKETTSKVRHTDGNAESKSTEQLDSKLDASLHHAFSMGLIDELISPLHIRSRLAQHLELVYRRLDHLPPARHSII